MLLNRFRRKHTDLLAQISGFITHKFNLSLGFNTPSTTRTNITNDIVIKPRVNNQRFNGLSISPRGGGTLATTNSSTSCKTNPILAEQCTASIASSPIISSISCNPIRFCGWQNQSYLKSVVLQHPNSIAV